MFKLRIIITSTQWPGHGGAATNAYNLIHFFRKMGNPVAGIFFEELPKEAIPKGETPKETTPKSETPQESNSINFDPDKLGGIFHITRKLTDGPQKVKEIIEYLGGEPDFILAKNYLAPVLSRQLFPTAKIVYLISGSILLTQAGTLTAQEFVKIPDVSKSFDTQTLLKNEFKAFESSNKVVPNSYVSHRVITKTYEMFPEYYIKLTNFLDTTATSSFSLKNPKIPIAEREYDLAFISSRLDRKIKNVDLAYDIFRQFPAAQKLIIGEKSHLDTAASLDIPNLTFTGKLSNKEVLEYFKKVKILVIPSYFDSSSNAMREAMAMGAIIMTSTNVGFCEILPDDCICFSYYDIEEWITKIKKILINPSKIKYHNYFDSYGPGNFYDDLLNIVFGIL